MNAASATDLTREVSARESGDLSTLSAATNAAQAAISAATNGLVTASVTNGLASAASVAQEAKDRAAAIKAEREARESAGYLTAESDPVFAAWRLDTGGVSIGGYSRGSAPTNSPVGHGSVAILGSATTPISLAIQGTASNENSIAIQGTASNECAVVIGSARGPGGMHTGAFSHGDYTFNIMAKNPSMFYFDAAGSWETTDGINYHIVDTARTLQSYLDERATASALADVKAMISETNETFASAVLQVGIGTLGITTNDLQVVHDLAELPVGTSITTVGGLLAALAAGLAALKKSVSSLSSKVDDANAALEEVA